MASDEPREEGSKGGGQVYLWHGYQNLSPRSFDVFSQTPVIKVAIGAKHAAFLTRNLEVYTYGNNQHGQLGNGTYTDSLKEPVLVNALKDQEVLDISCGGSHTGAVTFGGDVYCWGDSTQGQCGLGQLGRFPEPRLVKITETLTPCTHGVLGEEMRVTIAQISCGEVHTCVVSDVGEIWTWGCGVQLGLNKIEKAPSPQKIEYLEGRKVLTVSCGSQHTLALVEKLKTPSEKKSPSSESGRSSDSGLSSRSVTGLSICRSRSGSPIVNNNIQVHRSRPSTCLKCQQEIYTYTETTDACIISSAHKCPLGLKLDKDLLGKAKNNAPTSESEPEGDSSKSGHDKEESGNDDSSCLSTPDKKPLEVSINEDENEIINAEEFEDLSKEMLAQTQEESGEALPKTHTFRRQGTLSDKSESDMTDSEAGDVVHLEYVKLEESPQIVPDEDSVTSANEIKTDLLLQTTDLGTRRGRSPEPLKSPEVSREGADVLTDLLRGNNKQTQPGGFSAITKSKSSFLNEHEAKECLEKLLYGDEHPKERTCELGKEEEPSSPFVKNIENILQYVPSSPAAVQEYVTTLTKNVVSNIKTSIDKFSFVSSQNSMELESLSKSSSQDSINLAAGSKTPKEESSVSRSKAEGQSKIKDDGFLQFGSMTRSTSLGSFLKAKMNAERKMSLPSGELNLFKVGASYTPVSMETEVWSWGRGRQGQLGHGDVLDRRTPCFVSTLSDHRVIKVSAGSFHSAAVTAASQVYTWGSQGDGQLGHTDPSTSLPQKVKSPVGGQPMWDVATGHAHTIVAMDGTSFTPDVLYTGKQPSTENADTQKSTQLLRLSAIRKCGWIKQVVAGGDLCGCLTDRNTTGYTATLHEFAASERLYHCRLDTMITTILKPFLQSEHFRKLDSAMYETVFKSMVDAFQQIIDVVARNTIELTRVIQGPRELETLTILAQPEEYLQVFQNYSKQFGDTLALGGFEYVTKNASAFFEKVHESFMDVLDETKVEKSNMALTLRRLMQVPLHRLKDYAKLISKVALRYPSYTSEHMHLSQLSQDWDTLKQSASAEHTSAENTRKFWETCPPKFADALKVAGRRLVRESKANPLSIPSSGRFSMHWFILFSDVFVHGQYSMHQTFPLPTIWVEPIQDTNQVKNAKTLTMPEEVLVLTTPSSTEKAEWLLAFNQAIDKALSDQKHMRPRIDGARLTPPLARQATHVFYKNSQLKDAKYVGMWLAGKLHGHGELTWPDGRRYSGKFKQGMQHGHGIFSVPKDGETEVYDGHWKDGKMHGLGTYKYANGDVYEGYFKEGKKHGHGVLKRGKITSGAPPEASVYIGEWVNDKKCGYGVLDDISKGQKYMGMWQDDARHGNGIIVTLDCMYFEGTFTHDKMTGFGLLMTEDNSCYEGDFSGGPNLHGKGTLTLPNGDYIEGHFSGSFTEGIKIKDGMFYKAEEPLTERKGFTHSLGLLPSSFGKLSVSADRKWEDIFHHCYTILGCQEGQMVESGKAWETVAVMVSNGRKALKDDSKRSRVAMDVLEELEKIPRQGEGNLTLEEYQVILNYLNKAFETAFHPLGKLMEGLVDVYRATYMGIGAHHPRLLTHAVAEVKSYVKRIYPLVRLLFPTLPEDHRQLYPKDLKDEDGEDQDDESASVIITPGSLIYPLLLPKIYPPLFTLYALYNEREDERYWKRLSQWNKQSDMGLMASLGMDQKFWLIDESILKSRQQLSSVKDKCYREATETLQHISTSFSPAEKLKTIKQTFNAINKEVQSWVGPVQWCMDELFPVFLFVVVRAGIRHLGAEIHFIDDLMEPHLEHGELGIMFTTLKACYHQIQIEKI